jgi:hypothetical protein
MLLRVGGVVPPPTEPVELRERVSTGIGHAHRLVDSPADRSNAHLPARLAPGRPGFPLLVTPADGLDLEAVPTMDWADAAREVLEAELRRSGAVLLRGLPIRTAEDFSEFLGALDFPRVDTHGVSQRPEYADHVFGASDDVPATHTLHMHNEQAYLLQDADPTYPRKIFFACLQPPASGGQTPLVLNHEFHAALGEDFVQRFRSKGGVRYNRYLPDLEEIDRQQAAGVYHFLGPEAVRTSQESAIEALRSQFPSPSRDAALHEAEEVAWSERRGNSWQARLDATTRAEAEASCVAQEMRWEWQPDGGLMMFTDSPGFINAQEGDQGPASVWFSQASNFEAFTPTCAHYLPPTAHRLHAAARPSFACIPPAACRYRLAWLPAEQLQQPIDCSCVKLVRR